MLAHPILVEGNQGVPAGRTEAQPLLGQVIADIQSIPLQDNNATRNDMEDVVARDKDGNTMPCLFKSHRASSRKVPSRGLSRSTSVRDLNPMASTLPLRTLPSVSLAESRWHSSRALTDEVRQSYRASSRKAPSRGLSRSTSVRDLNPMASTLPLRTLPSVSLAESRWYSSRALNDKSPSRGLTSVADLNPRASLPSVSLADLRWSSSRALNDCPPKLPMEEEDSDDSSPNVGDLAPCSPRKTSQAKARSKASLQPVSTRADKVLPPKTVRRAFLAETRWDSSRSLSDNAPKTPSIRRKKQKDSGSHLRIMRDAPDNKSISPPAPTADKTPSPPRQTQKLIRTSSPPLESPTCVVTTPSDHNRKAMPRNSESARKQEQRLYSQSAFRDFRVKTASVASSQNNDEHALKDVLNEDDKII
jgi:hypothetical protein